MPGKGSDTGRSTSIRVAYSARTANAWPPRSGDDASRSDPVGPARSGQPRVRRTSRLDVRWTPPASASARRSPPAGRVRSASGYRRARGAGHGSAASPNPSAAREPLAAAAASFAAVFGRRSHASPVSAAVGAKTTAALSSRKRRVGDRLVADRVQDLRAPHRPRRAASAHSATPAAGPRRRTRYRLDQAPGRQSVPRHDDAGRCVRLAPRFENAFENGIHRPDRRLRLRVRRGAVIVVPRSVPSSLTPRKPRPGREPLVQHPVAHGGDQSRLQHRRCRHRAPRRTLRLVGRGHA